MEPNMLVIAMSRGMIRFLIIDHLPTFSPHFSIQLTTLEILWQVALSTPDLEPTFAWDVHRYYPLDVVILTRWTLQMIDTIVSNWYNVSIHRQLSLISRNLHCQVIEKPIGYESRGFKLEPCFGSTRIRSWIFKFELGQRIGNSIITTFKLKTKRSKGKPLTLNPTCHWQCASVLIAKDRPRLLLHSG